jgi:hypothetical protein
MTDVVFAHSYARAFSSYLDNPEEAPLGAAYELGRQGVAAGLGVLDLASVHHETLIDALASQPGEAARVVGAAGEFFLESLSAFEMLQRAAHAARDAAIIEKRQVAMVRQLSAFLGDTSLAVGGAESLDEVLHLVAEHARELVEATWCFATLALEGSQPLSALAGADAAARVDPEAIRKLCPSFGDGEAVRSSPEELARDPCSVALARMLGLEGPLASRLAVRLAALDGRTLGSIQLYEKRGSDFTQVDEATLLHLAQMAAAAIDRVRLFARV